MNTIFIVDDDESVINILKDIIDKRFPGTLRGVAHSGNKAVLDIIKLKPGVVLIDYLLPDIDGLQIIKEVRKVYNPSFIMLSQISDKTMIAKAYKENIEFFISKPINVIEVISVIERVLKYKKANQTISQLEIMFQHKIILPIEIQTNEMDDIEKLKKLYSKLGIIGNNGCVELIDAVLWAKEKGSNYALSEMYSSLASRQVELQPETIKKRMVRVIQKTFRAIVNLGMEDNLNPIYESYSGQLFNFEEIRKEMQYIKGKSKVTGKVNIRQFIESSIIIIKDM